MVGLTPPSPFSPPPRISLSLSLSLSLSCRVFFLSLFTLLSLNPFLLLCHPISYRPSLLYLYYQARIQGGPRPPPHKKLLPQIVRRGSRGAKRALPPPGGQDGLAPPPLTKSWIRLCLSPLFSFPALLFLSYLFYFKFLFPHSMTYIK